MASGAALGQIVTSSCYCYFIFCNFLRVLAAPRCIRLISGGLVIALHKIPPRFPAPCFLCYFFLVVLLYSRRHLCILEGIGSMLLAWAKGRDFQGTSRQALLGGSKHIAGGLLHPSLNSNLHPVLREIRIFLRSITVWCSDMCLSAPSESSIHERYQAKLSHHVPAPQVFRPSHKRSSRKGVASSIYK